MDRSAHRDSECVAVLENRRGPVVATEAVLTETLHLVGPSWGNQRVCLEFFLRGAFVLVPSSKKSLRRVAALLEKYRDVPMDFADATLVALGEELGTEWVFTLDRRGFPMYRLHGKDVSRCSPDALLPGARALHGFPCSRPFNSRGRGLELTPPGHSGKSRLRRQPG